MGKQNQNEEINRKLEVLRSNARKQHAQSETFNQSRENGEQEIRPEPTDIDEDTAQGDNLSEDQSNMRKEVYGELGRFERRFNS